LRSGQVRSGALLLLCRGQSICEERTDTLDRRIGDLDVCLRFAHGRLGLRDLLGSRTCAQVRQLSLGRLQSRLGLLDLEGPTSSLQLAQLNLLAFQGRLRFRDVFGAGARAQHVEARLGRGKPGARLLHVCRLALTVTRRAGLRLVRLVHGCLSGCAGPLHIRRETCVVEGGDGLVRRARCPRASRGGPRFAPQSAPRRELPDRGAPGGCP